MNAADTHTAERDSARPHFNAHDVHWMRHALLQAHMGAAAGEVPVGAVIVKGGEIIASAHNRTQATNDPCAHAEVLALREAGAKLGTSRLDGCTLYVTLEPCTMCAGAALGARLDRVVFGAREPKTGAAGSVHNVFAQAAINHRTRVAGGLLGDNSVGILQNFFTRRRQQQREAARAAHPLPDFALRLPIDALDAVTHWPEPSWRSDLPAAAGLRLAVVDTGGGSAELSSDDDNGPITLLCIHGHGDWSHVFAPLVRRWQRQCDAGLLRIVAPDLAGAGRSDQPKKAALHTAQWHATQIAQWVRALALRRVVVLGLGDGAGLALMAARQLPAGTFVGGWLHNAWPPLAHLPAPAPWLQWHAQAAHKTTWPVGQRQAQLHGWTHQAHSLPEHPRQMLDDFVPAALDALIERTSGLPVMPPAAAPIATTDLCRASEIPFETGGARALLQAWPDLHAGLEPPPPALLPEWARTGRLWVTLDVNNPQMPPPLWQQAWQAALGAADANAVLQLVQAPVRE